MPSHHRGRRRRPRRATHASSPGSARNRAFGAPLRGARRRLSWRRVAARCPADDALLRRTGDFDAVVKLGVEVERVSGGDRYETAYLAASAAVAAGADPTRTIFATGRQWPDAVSGSALAGRLSAPMVLLDGQQFDARPPAGAFIDRFSVRQGIVLGGTAAVAPATADDLADRILSAATP